MTHAHLDAKHTSPAGPLPETLSREVSFDEAIALYYGEWVLMKITEFDEHHVPVKGFVIAHSPKRGDVSVALAAEPPRVEGSPYQPYYAFNAFPRVHIGETFDQAVERFAAQRAAVEQGRRGERQ